MTRETSRTPRVSIICLSYNRPHLLADALAGLAGQTYPNIDVMIIDNRSTRSDEVAAVAARYPQFEFIANLTNAGFAGGMNQGMRAATGEYVCLTEDDLVLDPDYVAALVRHMTSEPATGIAGGLLVNRASGTILCAGADYALAPVYKFLFRREGESGAAPLPTTLDVPFVSGSVMFGRRDFINGVLGGFREDFFVYHEDMELCHRATAAGRRLVIVPAARALHAEVAPGPPAPAVEFHKWKNLYAVYFLHARGKVLLPFVLRYAGWLPVKALMQGRFVDFRSMAKAWLYVIPRVSKFLRERSRSVTSRACDRALHDRRPGICSQLRADMHVEEAR